MAGNEYKIHHSKSEFAKLVCGLTPDSGYEIIDIFSLLVSYPLGVNFCPRSRCYIKTPDFRDLNTVKFTNIVLDLTLDSRVRDNLLNPPPQATLRSVWEPLGPLSPEVNFAYALDAAHM